jgi:predicted RecB family nuclease
MKPPMKPLPISLLNGLHPKARDSFAAAGITDIRQIVELSPEQLMQFKGVKSTAAALHAHARAWCEERPVWYGTLHEDCIGGGGMFDIETNPQTGEVWSIGFCGKDNVMQTVVVSNRASDGISPMDGRMPFELPDGSTVILVPDSDAAWQTFADYFGATNNSATNDNCPVFHWTGFDSGVMVKTAPAGVTRAMLNRLHDLCRTYNATVKCPIHGASLKTVARYMGFDWRTYDDWFAAWSDYNRWLRHGNVDALTSACSYQRDDVIAMQVVREWLVANYNRSDNPL